MWERSEASNGHTSAFEGVGGRFLDGTGFQSAAFRNVPRSADCFSGFRRAKHFQATLHLCSCTGLGMPLTTSIPIGRVAVLANPELLQRVP